MTSITRLRGARSVLSAALMILVTTVCVADDTIDSALERSGDNRAQLERALRDVSDDQRAAMEFLIVNMPDRDLTSLSADFLLDNVRLAYAARDASPWKDRVPEDVFFNNVLPYANINERRDSWRRDFRERFHALVENAKSPSEAAAALNREIFPLLKVRYSTGRPKADQSPYESIQAGTASCTGLSVMLIDACRSVGVPARFVGTPLWTNKSGNHSWVEIWDDGWHFTGAAEPTGEELDRAWFVNRASTAVRDHPLHAIYAVSFKRTPIIFPLVWDRGINYIHAVNVTDRYVRRSAPLAEGMVRVMFRVVDVPNGTRQAAAIKVTTAAGDVAFEGTTNDDRFDANDHTTVVLALGEEVVVEVMNQGQTVSRKLLVTKSDTPVTIVCAARSR